MEQNKVLQLIFKNSAGKKITMSIEDPIDALTEAEIKAAMDVIIQKNIFKKNNYDLIEAVEAKIVTTGTTVYDLVV